MVRCTATGGSLASCRASSRLSTEDRLRNTSLRAGERSLRYRSENRTASFFLCFLMKDCIILSTTFVSSSSQCSNELPSATSVFSYKAWTEFKRLWGLGLIAFLILCGGASG